MAQPLNPEQILAAEETFRVYLRQQGLKYTPERAMVLREVLQSDEHFEAEQLLVILRQRDRRVAKATIYRTLPLLVACGILRQVQLGDNLSRYEHTFDQESHDHMVCIRCGKVIEFDSAEVDRLRDSIARRQRFQVVSHRFQITGVCGECREKGGPDTGRKLRISTTTNKLGKPAQLSKGPRKSK